VLLNLDLMPDDILPGRLVAIDIFRPEPDKPQKDAVQPTPFSDRRYVCVATDMPKHLKDRYATVEVFVAKHIAEAFGMKKGTQVTVTPVCLPSVCRWISSSDMLSDQPRQPDC
jgi:hypothetical protein